jgi:Flp pilus assembly protein TadD
MFGEIVTYNDCPSPEALTAYANDDLAKAEIRRIEMHVLECPLCSEAIELYMQGEAQTIAEIDKNVSQYIDNQYDRKIIPIWKRVSTYGIAASFLLMFGVVHFLAKPKENNLANVTQTIENQETKKDTFISVEPNLIADNDVLHKNKTITTLEKKPTIVTDRAITETAPSMPQADEIATTKPTAAKTDIVQANEVNTSPQISIEPTISKEQNEARYTPNARYGTDEKIAIKKAKKNTTATDLFRKGSAFYKTNNFAEAAKVFKEILADEPNNQGALYYLGLSEEGRGFYQNAIEPFSKVDSGNQNYYDAQFKLAQSYLKINKLAKAKVILKVLSESENPNRAAAQKLLEQF